MTSSFPSMTIPSDIHSPTSSNQHLHSEHTRRRYEEELHHAHHGHRHHGDRPDTATLAVFDPQLSTKTRIKALASSLAINLLLPFINGVMLGFGEIAAKSLFAWNGWGNVTSSLGLSGSSSVKRERIAKRGKDTPTLLTMP